jgi:hypothetical protein
MRRPGLLVALVLAVGLAGSVIALRSREGNTQFVAQQQQGPLSVTAAALEQLILTTKDPRPRHAGRAREAHCASALAQGLGNPWTCVVRYPRLPRVRFHVTVHGDRSIYGSAKPEGTAAGATLTVSGCCV